MFIGTYFTSLFFAIFGKTIITLMDARELLLKVDEFSSNKIKLRDDLFSIINEAVKNDKVDILEKLSFSAKYVNSLMRILKEKKDVESLNIEQVQKDLSDNVTLSVQLIREILAPSDDITRGYFDENFLGLNQQNFLKLTELFSDLEWLKLYLNAKKRNKAN